jgi:hypothetical protein
MKIKIPLNSLLFFLLTACAPSQEAIQKAVSETLSAILTPTPSAQSTQTQTLHQTVIVVTSTPTPSLTKTPFVHIVTSTVPFVHYAPTLSPTITQTPTITPTPTDTPDPLYAEKGPGIYLVGTDIAPGVWRSQSKGDNCYWKRSTEKGDIIDNYFGFAGGTIYTAPTDFSVELSEECGSWVFLSKPK